MSVSVCLSVCLCVRSCLRDSAFFRFGTVPACGRQTYGRTHDDSIYRASIASRGKNSCQVTIQMNAGRYRVSALRRPLHRPLWRQLADTGLRLCPWTRRRFHRVVSYSLRRPSQSNCRPSVAVASIMHIGLASGIASAPLGDLSWLLVVVSGALCRLLPTSPTNRSCHVAHCAQSVPMNYYIF